MRTKTLLVALIAAAGLLAGCSANDDGDEAGDEGTGGDGGHMGHGEAELPSGQSARDYIESYVMTHPFRVQGDATDSFMEAARADLVTILEGFGNLSVVRDAYEGDRPGVNILAFQNGTVNPHQWVVLSAHYDTVGAGGVGPTVYGAWDDGAGTASIIELARTLSQHRFPFTIVYAFFDGEEKGLVGSGQFVQKYIEDPAVDLLANLNTDPPGLNWPCGDAQGPFPVRLIEETEKAAEFPRYAWLYDAVAQALNDTEVPEAMRDFSTQIDVARVAGAGLGGSSDHVQFGEVDVANVYFGGTPTTRVGDAVAVLTYSFHTPLDTLQQMEARCSTGEGTLADGLQTILGIMSNTLFRMAETPVPA